MKNIFAITCLWLSGLVMGWIIGQIASASTIATECQKLGGFYVGSVTYECKVSKVKQ